MAFSPDGETLVSGSNDQTVCLWDVASPRASIPSQPRKTLVGYANGILSVAFSPDGQLLASGGTDRGADGAHGERRHEERGRDHGGRNAGHEEPPRGAGAMTKS